MKTLAVVILMSSFAATTLANNATCGKMNTSKRFEDTNPPARKTATFTKTATSKPTPKKPAETDSQF